MEIVLPTAWESITVDQFQRIDAVHKVKDAADIMLEAEIISVLANVPVEEVMKISLTDLKVINQSLAFMETLPSTELQEKIKHRGEVYWFNNDLTKLLISQYIDVSVYTKSQGDIVANLHILLSIFLRPKGDEYSYDTMIARAEVFKHLPVSVAYPMVVFFCNVFNNFVSATKDYLEIEAQNQIEELKLMLKNEGIAIPSDGNGTSFSKN